MAAKERLASMDTAAAKAKGKDAWMLN